MRPKSTMYRQIGKRAFDYLLVMPGLLVAVPVMGMIALLVYIKLGSPVFFRQERPGLEGRPFRLFKFRTMTDGRDLKGRILPDIERLTPFGRFLRGTSLDELPELFNVLRGEMSFVGPRPLLTQYLDLYTPDQARRHEVRPGITGLTQVMGRNLLTWRQKLDYDVWYINNFSFWLDIKILTLTIWKIIKREGISQPGHETMEEFQGNGDDNEG